MDKEERRELIKSRVRQTVKYSGYPQWELGEMMGTNQTQISAWARGKAMPDIVNLSALCEALKINPAWMLGLSERREL